ncbi:TIGR03089 family protein, partial [Mycobacterium sp.]|uniref:TIGR03089 family protein n=1 Tax=Mycobacterium sp. TaxID=1785 RepID=UPI002C8D9A87
MTNLTATVLDPLLHTDPAGPRITYYDDATGERIELSTVTLANWAAKTGNLLRDELGEGAGSRVAVLLPAHWQTAGVLLGIWWIGAEAVIGAAPDADVAMCTAERLSEADAAEVVALSLDPFGRPVPGLPVGVTDYATSVRVHGDQIVAEARPGPALAGRSPDDVLEAARNSARSRGISGGDRVLSTSSWNGYNELVDNL